MNSIKGKLVQGGDQRIDREEERAEVNLREEEVIELWILTRMWWTLIEITILMILAIEIKIRAGMESTIQWHQTVTIRQEWESAACLNPHLTLKNSFLKRPKRLSTFSSPFTNNFHTVLIQFISTFKCLVLWCATKATANFKISKLN